MRDCPCTAIEASCSTPNGILAGKRDTARPAFRRPIPWVIGFGDGYHLEALLENGRTEDMVVVEPDGGMLRAVLEDRDLRHVLERTRVLLDEPPARIADKIPEDRKSWYIHPPSKQIHCRFLEALQALSSYRPHEKDRLRILVVGPVYGGSYPIACYLKDAFEDLGHTVSFVDLAAFYPGYQELQAWDAGSDLLRPLEQLLSRLIERRAEVFSPDVIVVLAQAPICEESLKRMRGEGTPVAYWFVEDYRRMPYWKRLATSTDAFFVIQREARDAIQAAGAPFVRYLPLAAQPSVHRPCRLSPEEIERYGSAVSFVGAGYRNRRNFLARLASPRSEDLGKRVGRKPVRSPGGHTGGGKKGQHRRNGTDLQRLTDQPEHPLLHLPRGDRSSR